MVILFIIVTGTNIIDIEFTIIGVYLYKKVLSKKSRMTERIFALLTLNRTSFPLTCLVNSRFAVADLTNAPISP